MNNYFIRIHIKVLFSYALFTKQHTFSIKIYAEFPSHTTVTIALLGFIAYKFSNREREESVVNQHN